MAEETDAQSLKYLCKVKWQDTVEGSLDPTQNLASPLVLFNTFCISKFIKYFHLKKNQYECMYVCIYLCLCQVVGLPGTSRTSGLHVLLCLCLQTQYKQE